MQPCLSNQGRGWSKILGQYCFSKTYRFALNFVDRDKDGYATVHGPDPTRDVIRSGPLNISIKLGSAFRVSDLSADRITTCAISLCEQNIYKCKNFQNQNKLIFKTIV